MMSKKIALFLATLFAAIALTACGSSAPKVTVIGNSSTQEKTATPVPSK
jgi:hypothetical protein